MRVIDFHLLSILALLNYKVTLMLLFFNHMFTTVNIH